MERPSDPEGDPELKKRRLLCVAFTSVARCDAAVAQCYLSENDWEMEVGFAAVFLLCAAAPGGARVSPLPVFSRGR